MPYYHNYIRDAHPLSTNLASRTARLSSTVILAAISLVFISNYDFDWTIN